MEISMLKIQWIETDQLKPNPHNVRTHPKHQIDDLAKSIQTFGFVVPIVANHKKEILLGTARWLAAGKLGMKTVPVIVLDDLSAALQRGLALADNKIAEKAGWDRKALAMELAELRVLLDEEEIEIEVTGFATAEIDLIAIDMEEDSRDPADARPEHLKPEPVSKLGDIWILGEHKLGCGDAGDREGLRVFMEGQRADMAFLDWPYNRKPNDIGNKGRIKHDGFAMGSGELSEREFREKLHEWMAAAASVSRDGAVHFGCTDWRVVCDVILVSRNVYGAMINLVVWSKSNSGMGDFYRSNHELIGVFRVGESPHRNTVLLGKFGRSRSNLWAYGGANGFGALRSTGLQVHPTPKPVNMVADAILDCTRRGDNVLDTFVGSGTTLLAAERVGRRAFCLDIEPRYVDATIRRWQAFTRKDAVDAVTGRTFNELERTGRVISLPRRRRLSETVRPTRLRLRG
jgi:DNA modification methylase